MNRHLTPALLRPAARHRPRALLATTALAAVFVLTGWGAPASATVDDVTVEVTPTNTHVALGEHIAIEVGVTNNGTATAEGVTVKIDITSLGDSGSVDPEDWVAALSRSAGDLDPGETRTISWEIQPISPGNFTLYAVALADGATTVAASNTLTVDVADRRSLNPDGVLPVAIGAPVVVGGLLGFQVRRNRRLS